MKKAILLMLAVMVFLAPATGYADRYPEGTQDAVVRGLKNVITGWMEIPITAWEYNDREGVVILKNVQGAVDGVIQAIARTGSGVWDLFVALIPDEQEGLPVEPETLF